ncbi:MAG: transglutaminase family protein [Candidatus Omnitrophica bacterium]|nr:transglutaminase family protein [Candidatus Omnitrophota bacterium]
MLIKIDHKTTYRYSDNVFLEPHIIRLIPRTNFSQQVIEKNIMIDPVPVRMTQITDQNNADAYLVWFTHMTRSLSIHSSITVETREFNPFDFIIYPNSGQKLPLPYTHMELLVLKPYLQPLAGAGMITDFAEKMAEHVQWSTIAFLTELAQFVQNEFQYESRLEATQQSPEVTFGNKKGSCRDFVLFCMAVCRHLNIASRFVTGYYFSDEPDDNKATHAWMEVYLPGGGWKGYDPTHGIACYERHVTLSTSSEPQLTSPISGTYRGFANSHMTVELSLSNISSERIDSPQLASQLKS